MMSKPEEGFLYPRETWICPDEVSWIVESRGIRLVHAGSGQERFLPYPEAALWDLASRYGEMEKIIHLLAVIMGSQDKESRIWILHCMDEWESSGWLLREKNYG